MTINERIEDYTHTVVRYVHEHFSRHSSGMPTSHETVREYTEKIIHDLEMPVSYAQVMSHLKLVEPTEQDETVYDFE